MKQFSFSHFQKIIGYLFLSGVMLFFSLIGIIYSQYGKNFTGTADCGVIFGAAVWKDDQPSHALYDRTMAGIALVKNQQVDCLVLSGGPSTYGAHEVTVMQNLLAKNKVNEIQIITDYDGINTLQTIRNLDPSRSYVMISNDFHLARIRLLAWREGLNYFTVHAAAYDQGRYHKESYFVLREIAGLAYYGLGFDFD